MKINAIKTISEQIHKYTEYRQVCFCYIVQPYHRYKNHTQIQQLFMPVCLKPVLTTDHHRCTHLMLSDLKEQRWKCPEARLRKNTVTSFNHSVKHNTTLP